MKKNKLVLLILLLFTVCLSVVFTNTNKVFAWSYPTNEPAVTFEGQGTKDDPYQITSTDDLILLSYLVNNNVSSYPYSHYILTKNIVLNTGSYLTNKSSWQQWVPIGDFSTTNAFFSGVFDGAGYAINGLYINNTQSYSGLFGYVKDRVVNGVTYYPNIYNVTINNSYSSGGEYVSLLSGFVYSGLIENSCVINSQVKGTKYVGAISGRLSSGCVQNCYVNATVSGTYNTGALIGYSIPQIKYSYYSNTLSLLGVGDTSNKDGIVNQYNSANAQVVIINNKDVVCYEKVEVVVVSYSNPTTVGRALNNWLVSVNNNKFCTWNENGSTPLLTKTKYKISPSIFLDEFDNANVKINNGYYTNGSVVPVGTNVTINLTTDETYYVASVFVINETGETELTMAINKTYNFVMVDYDTTIKITIKQYEVLYKLNNYSDFVYANFIQATYDSSLRSNNGIIKLIRDITISEDVEISKSNIFTIDLNGFDLSLMDNKKFNFNTARITILNSTKDASSIIGNFNSVNGNDGLFTMLGSTVVVKDISVENAYSNVFYLDSSSLTIDNATLQSLSNVIIEKQGENSSDININSSVFHTIQDYAMLVDNVTCNITNSNFNVSSGLMFKENAVVEIYDSTMLATQNIMISQSTNVSVFSGIFTSTGAFGYAVSGVNIFGGFFLNADNSVPFDDSCLMENFSSSYLMGEDVIPYYTVRYPVSSTSILSGVSSWSDIRYGYSNLEIIFDKIYGYNKYPESVKVYKNNVQIDSGYKYHASLGVLVIDYIDGYYTVEAIVLPEEFEIIFDVTGGEQIDKFKYTFQDSFYLPVTTKAGFNFKAWKVVETNGSWQKNSLHLPTKQFSLASGNVVLQAVWEEKTDIVIDDSQTINMYCDENKGYVVKGLNSDLSGFAIKYKMPNAVWLPEVPTEFGIYDVLITREEDSTFKYFRKTVLGGYYYIRQQVEIPATYTKQYNGQLQTADYFDNDVYTVELNNGGIEVGNYPVKLKLIDFDHYAWLDTSTVPNTNLTVDTCTFVFSIRKADNSVKDFVIKGNFVGDVLSLDINLEFGEPTYKIFKNIDGNVGEEVTATNLELGNYFVLISCEGTKNYSEFSEYYEFYVDNKPDNTLLIIILTITGVLLIGGTCLIVFKYKLLDKLFNKLNNKTVTDDYINIKDDNENIKEEKTTSNVDLVDSNTRETVEADTVTDKEKSSKDKKEPKEKNIKQDNNAASIKKKNNKNQTKQATSSKKSNTNKN